MTRLVISDQQLVSLLQKERRFLMDFLLMNQVGMHTVCEVYGNLCYFRVDVHTVYEVEENVCFFNKPHGIVIDVRGEIKDQLTCVNSTV